MNNNDAPVAIVIAMIQEERGQFWSSRPLIGNNVILDCFYYQEWDYTLK